MRILPVNPEYQAVWQKMRTALWPDTDDEHAAECTAFFAGTLREPLAVLLALDDAGVALGFIELNLRNYAEGCASSPVGYVEGWYVVPQARRQGVGAALMMAGETWARACGCAEMASDTELDNGISATAHQALGYEETDRIICFRKTL